MKKADIKFEIVRVQTQSAFGNWFEKALIETFDPVFRADDKNYYFQAPVGSLSHVFSTMFILISSETRNLKYASQFALMGGPHMMGGLYGRERTQEMLACFDDGLTYLPDWSKKQPRDTVLVDFHVKNPGQIFQCDLSPCIPCYTKPSKTSYLFKSKNSLAALTDHIEQYWTDVPFSISRGECLAADRGSKQFLAQTSAYTVPTQPSATFYDPYPEEPVVPEKKPWLQKTTWPEASR